MVENLFIAMFILTSGSCTCLIPIYRSNWYIYKFICIQHKYLFPYKKIICIKNIYLNVTGPVTRILSSGTTPIGFLDSNDQAEAIALKMYLKPCLPGIIIVSNSKP